MTKQTNQINSGLNEYVAFGNNLKNLLRENKITNKELGHALGLSDQTISDYLNWLDNKKGKQPFWVPMLKLIKYLEQNIDNFNIYNLITKRYESTNNLIDMQLQNKPRLKLYKKKLDELNNKYKTLINKYNNDLVDYQNKLKQEKELKNELTEASRNIYILQKSIKIKDIKIEKLEKRQTSLVRKISTLQKS